MTRRQNWLRHIAVGGWTVLTLALVPQARELTLQQALQLATEHSHEVGRATAQREASESAWRSARASRLPTLSARATAFYNDDLASFDIDLPDGQTLSREIGSNENYQTDLRLTLPLLTGGRIGGGVAAARAVHDLSTAVEDATLEGLLYHTRVRYLSLIRAERVLDAATASLHRAQVLRNDIRSLYKAGAADSTDLLEAELVHSQAQLRLQQARHARRTAEVTLVVLLGLSIDDSLAIKDVLPEPDTMGVECGQSSKPELRAADAGVKLGLADLRLARANFIPSLSAFGGYSYGKPNLDFYNNTWNDYFTVGARLDWSFNLGRQQHHDIRAAHYRLEAAQRERDRVAESLDENTTLAYENLTLAYKEYELAVQRFRIADDNFRLARQRHRQGALSSNRLLEIEAELTEAEAMLAAARVDYYLGEGAYLYAVGSDKLRRGFSQ